MMQQLSKALLSILILFVYSSNIIHAAEQHTNKQLTGHNMFDDLEHEMYATGVDKEVDLPPPTRLEIFIRRIGTPLLIWYAVVRAHIVVWVNHLTKQWCTDDEPHINCS